MASSLNLLSHLWLHEPDAEAIARAVSDLGLPAAEPADLAPAYAEVLLLNVPPYGTAFTDEAGELNGPGAQKVADLYEAHGYQPPELGEVGAPDHLGLCLGFLAHLSEVRLETRDGLHDLLEWAPVCCLAVEREPSAHPFYRALASRTREWLMADGLWQMADGLWPMADGGWPMAEEEAPSAISHLLSAEEVRLRDIVRFFLAPARCGVFLSRSRLGRMAREQGLGLPFGSRFEVAEMLLASAGESGRIEQLLAALEAEVEAWAGAYRAWAEAYPAWRPAAAKWLARTARALGTLVEMRREVRRAAEAEAA